METFWSGRGRLNGKEFAGWDRKGNEDIQQRDFQASQWMRNLHTWQPYGTRSMYSSHDNFLKIGCRKTTLFLNNRLNCSVDKVPTFFLVAATATRVVSRTSRSYLAPCGACRMYRNISGSIVWPERGTITASTGVTNLKWPGNWSEHFSKVHFVKNYWNPLSSFC